MVHPSSVLKLAAPCMLGHGTERRALKATHPASENLPRIPPRLTLAMLDGSDRESNGWGICPGILFKLLRTDGAMWNNGGVRRL